ncbi:DUF2878 domain-containing protein [Dyella acidiphila]|uniref:DUF2878 domain-containing protein n=1 Tax=Dyella acidiphila TaxID=2775866 RepID=A0ABR9GD26_9GAMM|nr:DUF2878 domain-containing protein [Dyella acidiphila]MBE1161942.1 DUF2878 domain-containing protein [Dyella acidiphila]
MMRWINFIAYQLVWFAAVIGAAHGLIWPALLASAAFVSSQLALAPSRSTEWRLLGMALIFGVLIDGVAARMGWAHYATPSPAIPAHGAPVWILVLWLSFAMTVNQSLAYLRDRWWLALAFGAIGAPLAYLGAQRGWHAVDFPHPAWRGLIWLSVCWAIALPLLGVCARRFSLATRNAHISAGAQHR